MLSSIQDHHRVVRLLFAAMITIGCTSVCVGDVLILKNGGRIEGTLTNAEQSPRTTYVMRSTDGVQVTFSAGQVENFIPASEAQRRYEIHLGKMPNTAEANWKLAEWCRDKGLRDERKFHLGESIRLDPEHAEHEKARRALGFRRLDDKWIRREDFMRERGFVLHRGQWKLPQDVEMADSRREWDLAVKGWTKKIKRWRGWMGKKDVDKIAKGQTNILAIEDPVAADSIALLMSREKSPDINQLYAHVLGKLHTQTSTKALIQVVVSDSPVELRYLALDQLEVFGSELAIDAFIRVLASKNNQVVRRAGIGLQRLQDERSIRPLIDALVTDHKFVVSGGGSGQSISTSFGGSSGSGGGVGFGAGGGSKVQIQRQANREVLDALLPLTDGANFQYDQRQWRQWYIHRTTPPGLDLRRAP